MHIETYLKNLKDEYSQLYRTLDKVRTLIEYDAESDMYLISVQDYSGPYYSLTWKTFESFIVERKDLVLAGNGKAQWDRIFQEVHNDKAGVDAVTIVWKLTKKETINGKKHLPWQVQDKAVKIDYYAVPQELTFLQNDQPHHNYKPAVVKSNTDYLGNGSVEQITFMKHGKQCIPPEYFFPSQITQRDGSVATTHAVKAAKAAVDVRKLDKMFSRVPKARWDYLKSFRKHTKQCGFSQESFQYNDTEIPEEVFSLIEYPLDEADLFTLMMTC